MQLIIKKIFLYPILQLMMSITEDNCLCTHSIFVFYQLDNHIFIQSVLQRKDRMKSCHFCIILSSISYLDKRMKQLSIFYDSAGGQNKNYNIIKWLHFITNKCNLLNRVGITFPHSRPFLHGM